MRENSGIWAGVVFLILWVIGVGAALTGTLDDLVVWIFGMELLKTIGAWLTAIVIAAIVILVGKVSGGGHGAAYGSTHVHSVAGTGEAARAELEKHEKAHKDVTAAVGGGGSTIHIWPDGGGWSGKTVFHDPYRVAALSPEKKIAIALAGLIAAPNTTSPTDKPHAKEYAREADNPRQAMRKGRSIARREI